MIDDEVSAALLKMMESDVIMMASPLYFFSASAQLKILMDRMFALYKWNNVARTMETPLRGKMLAFIGSAYEEIGMDIFEKPFVLTAEYTGMKYFSLLVPNAGVSGDVRKIPGIQKRATDFGAKLAESVL